MVIRTLRDTDRLDPPYWPLGDLRPANETTLIARDDESAKIIGLCWLAYGGPVAMIGVRLAADPGAVWPLCNAARRLAAIHGCRTILFHVEPGKVADRLRRRGGMVIETPLHLVSFPITGEE